MKSIKVTKKNFFEEAGKFHKYFNFGVSDEIAQRSVNCKAGRLEINCMIYKGKLHADIYTHPNETAFESEVFAGKFETIEDAVKALKKAETEYKNKKSWWNK